MVMSPSEALVESAVLAAAAEPAIVPEKALAAVVDGLETVEMARAVIRIQGLGEREAPALREALAVEAKVV